MVNFAHFAGLAKYYWWDMLRLVITLHLQGSPLNFNFEFPIELLQHWWTIKKYDSDDAPLLCTTIEGHISLKWPSIPSTRDG